MRALLVGALIAWAPAVADAAGDPKCITTSDNRERCYQLYIPSKLKGSSNKVPLVVELHGLTGTSTGNRYTGWEAKADLHGFVLVQPQGTGNSWNAGQGCCGSARSNKVDDVAFLRQVVDTTVRTEQRVDGSRVYFAGHSNGCGMAQRMAAEASDIVTAVGCHSLYLLAQTSSDYTPVPIMEIHGDADPTVPYASNRFYGAEPNAKKWADLNKCNSNPKTTTYDKYTTTVYSQCQVGTVELVTLPGVGHQPYRYRTGVDTTELAWQFVSQYSSGTQPQPQPHPQPQPQPESDEPSDEPERGSGSDEPGPKPEPQPGSGSDTEPTTNSAGRRVPWVISAVATAVYGVYCATAVYGVY